MHHIGQIERAMVEQRKAGAQTVGCHGRAPVLNRCAIRHEKGGHLAIAGHQRDGRPGPELYAAAQICLVRHFAVGRILCLQLDLALAVWSKLIVQRKLKLAGRRQAGADGKGRRMVKFIDAFLAEQGRLARTLRSSVVTIPGDRVGRFDIESESPAARFDCRAQVAGQSRALFDLPLIGTRGCRRQT